MEKKKNVTIPEELFIDLVKYFLADIRWDEDRIRSRLQEKLEAMVKRELYTRYKTARTPEEREQENYTYALEECQGDDGKLGVAVIHCITIVCHDCLYDHESLAIKRPEEQ